MIIGVSCTSNLPTPNDSANLTVLMFSEGILLLSLNSGIMNYSLSVEYTTDTIHFTAISEDDQADIKYRWQAEGESWSKWYDIFSGMPSSDLTLKTGNNTIEIFVESLRVHSPQLCCEEFHLCILRIKRNRCTSSIIR